MTKSQAALLDILGQLQCVRRNLADSFLKQIYSESDNKIMTILLQLRTIGRITFNDEYVMLPGRKPIPNIMIASDVMMSLTKGKFNKVIRGDKVFTIVYSSKNSK